jgi:hypothetical protein
MFFPLVVAAIHQLIELAHDPRALVGFSAELNGDDLHDYV